MSRKRDHPRILPARTSAPPGIERFQAFSYAARAKALKDKAGGLHHPARGSQMGEGNFIDKNDPLKDADCSRWRVEHPERLARRGAVLAPSCDATQTVDPNRFPARTRHTFNQQESDGLNELLI